jgi:hypothetical protein
MKKKELPLAVRQSIWIFKIGEKYNGKCAKCKSVLDCFNFYIDWDGGVVDFKKLNPICSNCFKKF